MGPQSSSGLHNDIISMSHYIPVHNLTETVFHSSGTLIGTPAHWCNYPSANHTAAAQCIKSCTYESTATINMHKRMERKVTFSDFEHGMVVGAKLHRMVRGRKATSYWLIEYVLWKDILYPLSSVPTFWMYPKFPLAQRLQVKSNYFHLAWVYIKQDKYHLWI